MVYSKRLLNGGCAIVASRVGAFCLSGFGRHPSAINWLVSTFAFGLLAAAMLAI